MKKYLSLLFLAFISVMACQPKKQLKNPIQPGIRSAVFGKIGDSAITQYTITNVNGMQVSVINYGATITSIVVPDKAGEMGDVVLGFDSLSGYLQNNNPYFGSTIGRYANRIKGGSFISEGKKYTLPQNDHGNTLHGGLKGLDKVIWTATRIPGDSGIRFTYTSADGDQGFPGELWMAVNFTVTAQNVLQIEYTASTTATTPVNATNHAYFNLSAGKDSTILQQEVTILADTYTEVDSVLIPTGKQLTVAGTPMDFTKSMSIGKRIAEVPGGYDHNWVLNKRIGSLEKIAEVYDPLSKRLMEVLTTEPGLQFYTGNFLDGSLKGKQGRKYPKHAAFCMEAQHFPNSPNQPDFPSTWLHPGEMYHQITQYKFSVH
ncbi:MAG: galactose mutarotase [Sediminibacterium sp.]|nr:galactose mutarotase [Sediminibacterium sp.]